MPFPHGADAFAIRYPLSVPLSVIRHPPSAIRHSLIRPEERHVTPVRPPPRRLWPLLALAGVLTLLLGLALRDSAASTATDRLFQSVLPSPTAVRTVTRTPTRTATVIAWPHGHADADPHPHGDVAGAGAPARRSQAPPAAGAQGLAADPNLHADRNTHGDGHPHAHVHHPTPIKYGWRGIGQTGLADALGAKHYPPPTPSFWDVKYDWWYNWDAHTDASAAAAAALTPFWQSWRKGWPRIRSMCR